MSAVAGSRLTKIVGGLEANFLRIVLATALLGLYAHTIGGGFSGRALPYFLLSGLIGFGIGDLALYQAFPRIGSRLSMILVHCLAAPIGATAEWYWLGTELSARQISCSVLILAGVATALAPREHLHIPRKVLAFGIICGVIAACGQGFGTVVSRKAYSVASSVGESIDGLTAAYQRIWGGVLFAAIPYVIHLWRRREDEGPAFTERMRPAWKWLAANATIGPAIGVGFMQYALAHAPTGIVLPIIALAPLTIIPFSKRFEGEQPTARSLIGGAIAVAGVIGLRFSLK